MSETPKKYTRRQIMAGAATALIVGGFESAEAAKSYPFTLGVASGDPLPDSVVLWTRLAPDPLNGGGMGLQAEHVRWEIADAESFRSIVQSGATSAMPEWGHSIHIDVKGLKPSRTYWYRFHTDKHTSPVGRTRTAPSIFSNPDRVRFAFASCQNFEHGYYTAHQHMSRDEIDFVVFLGDYIYEGGRTNFYSRIHNSKTVYSLDDYRNRYALYKSDKDLQACHAAHPWIVTWDDHEVENNYAGMRSEKKKRKISFAERRRNAYRAYYEHMPLRLTSRPNGISMRLYRPFQFGTLIDLNILDTRQYRTPLPRSSTEMRSPISNILGKPQEAWLYDRFGKSQAIWNVVAQQVIMTEISEGLKWADKWSGYRASRERLFEALKNKNVSNPVILSGDHHRNWAANLLQDFDDQDSLVIGTEFVGTSISSNGDGKDMTRKGKKRLDNNPHLKFFNYQRGYVRLDVSPEIWRTDFQVVEYVSSPGAKLKTRASFVVERDAPGAIRA
jgi:alkaline phosphatase D